MEWRYDFHELSGRLGNAGQEGPTPRRWRDGRGPRMDGQVLKLFRERSPYHGHELAATRAASATALPVPALKSVITALYRGAKFPPRSRCVSERSRAG